MRLRKQRVHHYRDTGHEWDVVCMVGRRPSVAAAAVTLGDVGGSQRRTAVLARVVGDALSAYGVREISCGAPRVVGAGEVGA